MNSGYLLAFYQENPRNVLKIKAILSCDADGKIMVQSLGGKKLYKGNLLYGKDNMPVVPNGDIYLKLLGQTSSLSQITFLYTEDLDVVAEHLKALKI